MKKKEFITYREMKMTKMKYLLVTVLSLCVLFVSCQKSEDRTCWKGAGDDAELSVGLDSVSHFRLLKNIKYRIYQDNERRLTIKGGENLIKHIGVTRNGYEITVENFNRCNFLRGSETMPEVEIHYPHFNSFFIDPTDSVVFEGTICGDSVGVEMRDGGGSLVMDVDVEKIAMIVSHGPADFTLTGKADAAELKVQNNGAGNAAYFRSNYVFIYQNSTADISINLDNTWALIVVDGTGHVFYRNKPKVLDREGLGQGQIIQIIE